MSEAANSDAEILRNDCNLQFINKPNKINPQHANEYTGLTNKHNKSIKGESTKNIQQMLT